MSPYNDPRIDMMPIGPLVKVQLETLMANMDRAKKTGYPMTETDISPAEVQLAVSLNQAGISDFAQQHEVGPYFPDFYFPEGLVVEVDGAAYHQDSDLDAQRDKRLLKLGAREVIHLRAIEVFRDPLNCVEKIKQARARLGGEDGSDS